MAEPITAAQLIYGNVEVEQSPRRRRGFQTLYYTREALNTSEVLKLESYLTHESRGHPGQRQIFTRTATNKPVVARFVPLSGADKFGRAGRYFAHALIFNDAEFERLDCDPFAVLGPGDGPFFPTLEAAIAAGRFEDGDIPPARFAPAVRDTRAGSGPWEQWPDLEPLRAVLLAASQAAKVRAERRTIALRGSPEAVTAFLEALFALLPPPVRRECTFDNYASERMIDKLGYWAVGLPEPPPRRPTLWAFALDNPGFSPSLPLHPENGFERSFWEVLGDTSLPAADRLGTLGPAYQLSQALEERDLARAERIDPARVSRFLETNASRCDAILRDRLREVVGQGPPEIGRAHV